MLDREQQKLRLLAMDDQISTVIRKYAGDYRRMADDSFSPCQLEGDDWSKLRILMYTTLARLNMEDAPHA